MSILNTTTVKHLSEIKSMQEEDGIEIINIFQQQSIGYKGEKDYFYIVVYKENFKKKLDICNKKREELVKDNEKIRSILYTLMPCGYFIDKEMNIIKKFKDGSQEAVGQIDKDLRYRFE